MSKIKIIMQRWWHDLPILLLVNTLIAGLCTLGSDFSHIKDNFLISHSIGFSISIIHSFVFFQCADEDIVPSKWRLWRLVLVIPLGVAMGFKLAHLLGAPDLLSYFWVNPSQQWRWIATAVLLTTSATGFFIVFYRAQMYQAQLAKEQQQLAETKQSELAAQLAMLQAQIEPHFLFNTLANVRSLISRNPQLAQEMLDHLNHYLRASLGRTRKQQLTLAEELELVTSLLAISHIRLGERLNYHINVPEELQQAILPPLLLQPLVENALQHGIEPAVDGGEISIVADLFEQKLRLRVYDTGLGLLNTANQHASGGVGLSNVRKRLENLYAGEARLALYSNQVSGVISEIILPFSRAE